MQEVTAATEDVAVPRGLAFRADETALQLQTGVAQGVSVGAAAKERTPNTAVGVSTPVVGSIGRGVVIGCFEVKVDDNLRLVDVTILLAQVACVVADAPAAAVDVGIEAGAVKRADDGLAAHFYYALSFHQVAIIGHLARTGHIAATKHVLVNGTARNVHVAVAVDTTRIVVDGVNNIVQVVLVSHAQIDGRLGHAQVHVSVCAIATAEDTAVAVGMTGEIRLDIWRSDGASGDFHMGMAPNCALLSTAKDRAFDGRSAADVDKSLAAVALFKPFGMSFPCS